MSNPYQSPHFDDDASLHRTWVRFRVLLFLCSLALLLYIDRVCIGQAALAIREELEISETNWSWVNNAFIIAYCIFEVHTGHWGDRFGSRGIIARIVIWWSAFTALTGLAFGLLPLVAIRFLFGAGEAGAFPNVARVVTHWFPSAERGFARGAISTTSLVGGALAAPVAQYLITLVGWRAMFMIFGGLGVVWAAGFYAWFRDDPSQHSETNDAERKHIGAPPNDPNHAHAVIPWSIVLTSPNVWLLGSIQMVSATLFYMLFQSYPTYLVQARGISKETAALFTGIVIFGGALGCLTGGLISDWIIRNIRDRKWSRRICGGGAMLLAASSLACVRYCDNPLMATFCCSGALFFLQMAIPTWWTVVAEISGRHGASMWGLMNSMGGLGVFTMTFLVAYVVQSREAAGLPKIECWRPVFDGVAVALLLGVICWQFVDATRSIVERRPTTA